MLKRLTILTLTGLLSLTGKAQMTFQDFNGNKRLDPYEDVTLSVEERAKDILQRLSDEDKINLVVGIGFNIPGMFEATQPLRVPGAVGGTYSYDSLGIRGLITTDGPAGVRIQPIDGAKEYFCTAFPISTLVASTWDTQLAYEIGRAVGNEVKEYGMDILLAPGMNIHRNPLGGRNFEYFSEDPLLSGKMSAAEVKGVQSNGVGTSIKHFVANNQETNRTLIDVVVSERALREIYLKGFEIAVKEAKPWTIMSAYNQVNGTMASENSDLLTTVLRKEWGFEGLVMTDWFAGADPVKQMVAGNDLLMPGTDQQRDALRAGLKEGRLERSVLDRNALNVLKLLVQSPSFNRYSHSDQPDLESNAQLARRVAAEGAVLLKNDDVLPFNSTIKIAAFGNGSYDFISGGTGSGDVNEAYTISLVQGLANANVVVDETLKSTYEAYIQTEKAKFPPKKMFFLPDPVVPEMALDHKMIRQTVKNTDIGVITIGRVSGEFADRKVENDFLLTTAEQQMIDQVSSAYHKENKKVVLILNIGNVIEVASWRDKVDAILLPWLGGQEAGNAVADVLLGKVNPSGKLPASFPLVYNDVSSADNFPGEEFGEPIRQGVFSAKKSKVTHEEGIYIGYRYYGTFNKEVAYPFGYGLSYTDFEYTDLSVFSKAGRVDIAVNIKNTGKVEGREVVQVYLSAPGSILDQPEKELRAFAKTASLKPGTSETLNFSLSPADYASYDAATSSWILEPGKYNIGVGASSEDIRVNASFTIENKIVVEKVSNALNPKESIKELTSSD